MKINMEALKIIIRDLELQLGLWSFYDYFFNVLSWDWIMSIDTHWFSTLFGWYVFSEWAVIGFVSILLITLYLKRLGYLESVNESHIHDLGKYVFKIFFSLDLYVVLSIYVNLVFKYSRGSKATLFFRLEVENYKFLFWFRVAINFLFPIILLMSRDAKRNNSRLIFVCIVILIGHWLNSYLLVTPGP